MEKMTVNTYHYRFEEFAQDAQCRESKTSLSSVQLMEMYESALLIRAPVILELGVDRGASTTVFLQACMNRGGRLVSVDIRDCSYVANMPEWQFVRSDSTDIEAILAAAPFLRDGIDILYVDSLHTSEHVRNEVYGWYPYLRENARIFFDDIDPSPYRCGEPCDNLWAEYSCSEIERFVRGFFYANQLSTRLVMHYGSTGLACLRKLSPMGESFNAATPFVDRRKTILAIARYAPRTLPDVLFKRLNYLKRICVGRRIEPAANH